MQLEVQSSQSTRAEIIQVADIFRANIVDVSHKAMTMEVTGKEEKINAAIEMLQGFGIREIARTGIVALKREFGK